MSDKSYDSLPHKQAADSSSDKHDEQSARERLSKRLTYVLRYGARKEGLQVDDSGKDQYDECNSVISQKSHCSNSNSDYHLPRPRGPFNIS